MLTGSIRFRMMLLFTAVVGVLLAGSTLGFYALLSHEVRAQVDRQLQGVAGPVLRELVTEENGEDVNELNVPDEYFELIDTSGNVLQQSKNLKDRPLDLGLARLNGSQTVFETVRGRNQGRLRLCLIPFRRGAKNLLLVIAMPTRDTDQTLEIFRGVIAVLLPLILVLTGLISTWYVGRSLAPVTALTRHAGQMTERLSNPDGQEFWTPLAVGNPQDELGRLAETFNHLFLRVDSALGQLRQFVSDASHELRTPLSVLQGETELVLSEPRSEEEYRRTLDIIDGELKKLTRIVEGLFTLSMADAGQLRLARQPLYLNEVLEEAYGLVASRAQAKNIAIELDLTEEVPYSGDEAFLRQLFLIFLENAIKYSPPRTSVRVSLSTEDGVVRARFKDEGIGISQEHQTRIFERFYRVVQFGAGEAQSGGLGLAIAQAIARAQGGWIDCESTPGVGSTFTVTLPFERAEASSRLMTVSANTN
jgi:two-component system OmpR family sensor kinase